MNSILTFNRKTALALVGVASALTLTAVANGSDGYHWTNLVSDLPGVASFTDSNLLNPWGVLAGPEGHLIVADNHASVATFYGPAGRPGRQVISIPAPGGGGGAPTDLGFNWSERSFIITNGHRHDESALLFVTEDGTIAGWNPEVDANNAIIAVDNSGAGAIYKSMTVASAGDGLHLYAANFGQGMVDVYDRHFHWVTSFTDTNLAAANFVPFGIREIGGHLFVTFAFKASPTDGDETAGPGLGYVDEFDLHGNLLRQFAAQGTLNAPWGLALAPRGFGKFGGALLVGNFGDGTINAFNLHSGAFLGQLSDAQGNVIQIGGLWGLVFGGDGRGPVLYFTAGPNDENDGLLGAIRPDKTESHHR